MQNIPFIFSVQYLCSNVFQLEDIVGTAAFNSPFYMDLSRDMTRFIRRSGWRDSVQETRGLGGGQVIDGFFFVLVYLRYYPAASDFFRFLRFFLKFFT